MFGAIFERKVNPPMGTWVAFKMVNVIDPAVRYDLYAEKPWILSPALCAMNTVNVRPAKYTWEEIEDRRKKGEEVAVDDIIGTWDYGGAKEAEEDTSLLFGDGGDAPYDPTSVAERRTYFGQESARQGTLTSG